MRPRALALLVSAGAVVCACAGVGAERSSAAAQAPAVPAVLAGVPDERTRTALLDALRALAGDRGLLLSPDAFVSSSELVLERARPPGEMGRAATGREMSPPLRFRLLRTAQQCLIERLDDGRRSVLAGVSCRAQN